MKERIVAAIERITGDRLTAAERELIAAEAIEAVNAVNRLAALAAVETVKKTIQSAQIEAEKPAK